MLRRPESPNYRGVFTSCFRLRGSPHLTATIGKRCAAISSPSSASASSENVGTGTALVAPAATNAVLAASTRQVLPPPVKLIDAASVLGVVVPESVLIGVNLPMNALFAVMLVRLHDAPTQSPLNA